MRKLAKIVGLMCLVFILGSFCVTAAPNIPVSKLSDIDKAVDTGGIPVILMISTESCTTCKEMKEYFPILAQEYKGKVTFMFSDSEKYADVRVRFMVRSVPTTVFFDKNGDVVWTTPKTLTEAEMKQKMKDLKLI